MQTDATQEILKRVDALSAKLGVAADQLWAICMQQVKVEIVNNWLFLLIQVPLALFLAYSGIRLWKAGIKWRVDFAIAERAHYDVTRENDPTGAARRRYNDMKDKDAGFYGREHERILTVLLMIIAGVLLGCAFHCGFNLVSLYINPQYWVLQHLSADIKNIL